MRIRWAAPLLAVIAIAQCGSPRAASPQRGTASPTPSDSSAPRSGISDAVLVTPRTDQLMPALRQAFRARNPRLDSVNVVERVPYSEVGSGSLVLAHAIRGDEVFSGDFSDEQFCVFRTAPDERHIAALVHCQPTPRWNDYTLRFERIDRDSIVLVGTDGYGIEQAEVIHWDAQDAAPYVRPEEPWLGALVAFEDTSHMTFYRRPDGAQVRLDVRYKGRLDFAMQVVEIRGKWYRVAVRVPSFPTCDAEIVVPPRTDTAWVVFEVGGRRLLRRDPGPIC